MFKICNGHVEDFNASREWSHCNRYRIDRHLATMYTYCTYCNGQAESDPRLQYFELSRTKANTRVRSESTS